jgi:hypothetical protein
VVIFIYFQIPAVEWNFFFLFFARVVFHALWCRVDPHVTPMSLYIFLATCLGYADPEFQERHVSLSAVDGFGAPRNPQSVSSFY